MTASDSLRPSTEESTDSSTSKLSWKTKNRSEDSADSQAKLHNKKPPSRSSGGGGPRKTPFSSPEPQVTIPEPTPLSMEEETAYNSLLNAVSEWCVLTTMRDGATKSMPMVDEEYMWLTRECLLRYLRASKWNVATAQQRIIDTLQWRREYGITRVPASEPPKITAEYISVENETGKQWILGFDNDGRPCHYLNPHLQNTERSDRQIEHLVFMLERVIDMMPAGQESLALLMNFGETRRGQGASITQGKQVLHILQSHYPERLGKALLCNLPWHIWTFMKLITPFIDPVTRKKLVYDAGLDRYVPAAQLVVSHGGTLEFSYDHSIYWPSLLSLAAERRAAMFERWERGGKMVGEYEIYLRGGSARSLRDDRREHPNERGRGQPLGGNSPLRSGSKNSSTRSVRTRDRSVVVIHSDEDHPLKRSMTADSNDSFKLNGSRREAAVPEESEANGKAAEDRASERKMSNAADDAPVKPLNGETDLVASPTAVDA